MRIAYIGQKGIPATFGGVEYHVEDISVRLAQRGNDVTVYVRTWYTPSDIMSYEGVNLCHKPTINTKHLDAFVHCLICSLHCAFNRPDIVHYHAIGPSFFAWIPRIAGVKTVSTIHRFDYDAAKWGGFAKWFLRFCEKVALKVPHKTIVVAKHQQRYYKSLGYQTTNIPNGVPLPKPTSPEIIKEKYGLQGSDYILFLGRLVPEKRVDWVINAFQQLRKEDISLVIAGGSSATDDYVKMLKKKAKGNPKIIFTGYVSGQLKEELFSNAATFVIPSELEGLPIALLEAMSYGLPCLASDIPPHSEVIEESINGFLFKGDSFDDFVNTLIKLLGLDGEVKKHVGNNAREHVAKYYDWDDVVDEIEKLYGTLRGPKG